MRASFQIKPTAWIPRSALKKQLLVMTAGLAAGLMLSLGLFPQQAFADTIEVGPEGDYETIQEAVAAANEGDTISLSGGTHTLTASLDINKKDLTISGQGSDETVVEVSSSWMNDPDTYAIQISATGVTLKDMHVKLVGKGQGRLLNLAANNVTIRNNKFSGDYVLGDSQVSRAMVVWAGVTGVLIDSNTIHGLRQPAYISGASSSTGTIKDNYVYGTRGWVVETADLTFTGNRWGSGSTSNYVDIAILSGTSASLYTDLLGLSAANNGAVIEDQRSSPALLTKVLVRAGASGDGTPTNPYGRISDAVTRVVPNGTINVEAGTYNEIVTIDKSLTLRGPNYDISPRTGKGTRVPEAVLTGVTFTQGVSGVTIEGFRFTGKPQYAAIALATHAPSNITIRKNLIENVEAHGITQYDTAGFGQLIEDNRIVNITGTNHSGMFFSALADCTIRDNEIENTAYGGIIAEALNKDDHTKSVVITGNSIKNTPQQGIQVSGPSGNVTISNNVVTNTNTDEEPDKGGIRLYGTDFWGPVTITGNTVSNSYNGLAIKNGETITGKEILVENNNFEGNSNAGIYNGGTGTLNAANNWWGSANGPKHDSNKFNVGSQGVTVSDNVTFVPWLNAAPPSGTSFAPVTNGDKKYASIQAAVDAASSGDTINVSAGTFTESLKIEKPVNVVGAGKDQTILRPETLISTGVKHKYDTNVRAAVFVNKATDVTISEMTIDGNEKGANAVVFWNDTSGTLNELKILNPMPFSGAQTGQGLAVDASSPNTITLKVNNCDFEQWNKNAIDVVNGNGKTTDGGNITVDVNGGTFIGRGGTTTNGQNGILFWERAGGTINGSVQNATFSDIYYSPNGEEAAAILLYGLINGTVSPISNCSFNNTEMYITLAAGSKNNVLATGNIFDGISAASASNAELFTIEDKIWHGVDEAGLGLVRVKENNIYVTSTYSSSDVVQRGLDIATDGDTVNVAAGTYDESPNINGKNNFTLSGGDADNRPTITGGLNVVNSTGLTLKDFIVRGTATGSFIISAKGINDLTMENVCVDGENVAGRHGVGSGQINGDITITNCEFLNIKGWAAFDTRSGSGGPASGADIDNVIFSNNVIRNSEGHIAFRSSISDPAPSVSITNNTAELTGDTTNSLGGLIKVFYANSVTFTGNTIKDVGTTASVPDGEAVYGAGFMPRNVASLTVSGNLFQNNNQAIAIEPRNGTVDTHADGVLPGGVIENNTFIGNKYDIYIPATLHPTSNFSGLQIRNNSFSTSGTESVHNGYTAGTVNAVDNWWGSANGPTHASNGGGNGVAVSDNVTFSPWLGDGTDISDAIGFQPNATPKYGIPTKLVFSTQPGGAQSGSVLSRQPVVQATDGDGNLGINFSGTVRLAIGNNPRGGTLSGTSSVAASNGVASFSGLSISKSGDGYTLTASAEGLIGATSNAFNITKKPSDDGGNGGGGGGGASSPTPSPTPTPTPSGLPAGGPPQVGAPEGLNLGPMVSTNISSETGGSVATNDPAVNVNVPSGGANQNVVATYQQVIEPSAAPPQGSLALGSTGFVLEFRDPTTGEKIPTWAEITVTYTDADVAAAGGNPNNIALAIFDGTNWVPLPGTVNTTTKTVTVTTLIDATFALLAAPPSTAKLDYAIQDGWFFSQANGFGGAGGVGYTVTDADGITFWTEFQRLGGVDVVGYPVTQRFMWDGFVTQAFQKLVFQWRPESNSVAFVNVFDDMARLGFDSWLATHRHTPAAFDTSEDTGLPFEQVVTRHVALMDENPDLRQVYLDTTDWLNRYGLPVSWADYEHLYVVRAQRAVLQQWKTDMPWAKAGDVVVANGGDLAKEAGMWPLEAMAPVSAPAPLN